MPGQPRKVAVFDRSATFRRGLRALIEEAGYGVSEHDVGDVPASLDCAAVVATVETSGDVAHLADISAAASQAPLVVLAHDIDLVTVINAIRAGSTSVLPWTADPKAIAGAIDNALAGLATLPAHIVVDLGARVRPSSTSILDEQEAKWLQYLAGGRTVASLADKVGYSEREMFRTLAELYRRLGVSNQSEALVKAAQLGMLGDGPS